nr:hypothetical protein [uncultured Steroidobacter sp.]
MDAIRRSLLSCTVLAVMAVVAGCATTAPPVPTDFMPNGQEAIVFGRMEFVSNGTTLPPDTRFGLLKPQIIVHFSPLTDATVLNRSELGAAKFAVRALVSENGHFITKLPVGRYYVDTLGYFGTRGGNFTGWRTYAPEAGKPFLLTFDVLPNKATYLGTVRNFVWLGTQTMSRDEYSFNLGFVDERTEAEQYLLQRHPALRDSIESLPMQSRPLKPRE